VPRLLGGLVISSTIASEDQKDIAARLRYVYGIAYTPANRNFDGKYRKIRVDLIAPDGSPLTVTDPKDKKIQFAVYVRNGYVANRESIPTR
jgi:hypothetical protein